MRTGRGSKQHDRGVFFTMHFLTWIHHVGFPLAIGGMIYGLHFTWPAMVPDLIVHYIPDGMWAYALLSAIFLIWKPVASSPFRTYWLLAALLTGPILEFLQWQSVVPGQGDIFDVVTFTCGGLLSLYILGRVKLASSKNVTKPLHSNIISMFTAAMFTLFALATSLDHEYDYVDIRMEFEFGDEAVVMHNLNRFALLDWNVTFDDVRFITYHASGQSLAGMESDTLLYENLFATTPNIPVSPDSLTAVQLICRIIEGKMGLYSEELD